jgi:ubiquinone/menaquinone biosynthesis C-methylase UbiE
MIALYLLVLLVVVLIVLAYVIFILDIFLWKHDIDTSDDVLKIVISEIKETDYKNRNFIDLGCSKGSFCLRLKKQLPDLNIVGVDDNRLRILVAKLKNNFHKHKVTFVRKDIFNHDLRSANYIYTYLWPTILPWLEEKFNDELEQNTKVMCNETFLPNWEIKKQIKLFPKKKFSEYLFVYLKK